MYSVGHYDQFQAIKITYKQKRVGTLSQLVAGGSEIVFLRFLLPTLLARNI